MFGIKKFWGDKYIFTDNAFKKMREHKVSMDLAKKVLKDYKRSEEGFIPGSKMYSMKVSERQEVGVMAKRNYEGTDKTMIFSVWRRALYK